MPRASLRHARPIVRDHCLEYGLPYIETSLFDSYRQALHYLHTVAAAAHGFENPNPPPYPALTSSRPTAAMPASGNGDRDARDRVDTLRQPDRRDDSPGTGIPVVHGTPVAAPTRMGGTGVPGTPGRAQPVPP